MESYSLRKNYDFPQTLPLLLFPKKMNMFVYTTMLRVVASRGVIIALRRMQSMLLSCSKYPWKYVKIAFPLLRDLVECFVKSNHVQIDSK